MGYRTMFTVRHGMLFIWIFLLCNCLSRANQNFQCFNMPPFPLNGRLEASGSFKLTLVCPEADQDIPLNSPGYDGVLTCDATEPNHELAEMYVPDCVPIRYAKAVFLPFLIVFEADACVRDLNEAVEKFREENFPKVDNPNGILRDLTWSESEESCGLNSNTAGGKAVQIDIKFSLQTPYPAQVNFTTYLGELEKLREKMLEYLISEQFGVWAVDSAEVTAFDVGFWTADCEGVAGARGSILHESMVASCRGCSESFFYDVLQNKCLQCDFNYYTEEPYASECVPCPPESMWGSHKAKMLNLCFGRH